MIYKFANKIADKLSLQLNYFTAKTDSSDSSGQNEASGNKLK